MAKLTKSKICYDVTRNSDGEFARPTKTKAPGRAKITKANDARVTITRTNSGFKAVVVAPDLQKQARSANPETAKAAKSVIASIARDALEEHKRDLDRSSFGSSRNSDKARKAAASKKLRQSAQAKLDNKTNNALISYRPSTVYEKRAQKRLLKERGLVVAKKKRRT